METYANLGIDAISRVYRWQVVDGVVSCFPNSHNKQQVASGTGFKRDNGLEDQTPASSR